MQDITNKLKVLYTNHKSRKRKIYRDGILKVNGQKKAFLFNENHDHLATEYLAKSQSLEGNIEIELGEFLIQLNEPCTRDVKTDENPENLYQSQKKRFSSIKAANNNIELSKGLGLKQDKGSSSLVRNGAHQRYSDHQVIQEVSYTRGTDLGSAGCLTGHIEVQGVQVNMGSCPGSKEPVQAKCISTITESRPKRNVDEIMEKLKKVEDTCCPSEAQSHKKRMVTETSSTYSKQPATNSATEEFIRCMSAAAVDAITHDEVINLRQRKPLVQKQPYEVKDHHGENDQEFEVDGLMSQLTSLTDLVEAKLDGLGDGVANQDVRHTLEKTYFSAMDFWEGYKYYCIGYYAKSAKYQGKFFKCKMGHIIRRLYKEDKLQWNASLDEKIRKAWFIMEDYIMEIERVDCRDLESLIRKYDDPAKLATTEHGQFFLELCKSDGCSTSMPSFIVSR